MVLIVALPFALLWTLCTARRYDNYYRSLNVTRSTPVGIAAYRSALTLDWLAAEDNRQREMVAAIESESPSPAAKVYHSDCIDYARPPTGTIARLMLELLRNLEGDDGTLVPGLVQALVRAKLLVLETSVFDAEPDLESLVKTPASLLGEPHTTFPRILSIVWMAVTDPTTVKKHGWCTIKKMTSFLSASKPSEVARTMRAVEPIIARARFIMEEFIQHVTPLNMLQRAPPTPASRKVKPVASQLAVKHEKYRRPVRTHQEMPILRRSPTTTTEEPEDATLPPGEQHLQEPQTAAVLLPNALMSSSFTPRGLISLLISSQLLVL